MYARVATFEGGDVERIREMNQQRRSNPDWMPQGVRRVLVFNEADADRRLFITFFDDRAALDAAEAQFASMGDEIPEDVRGRRVSLDVYEVVADESVA